MIKTDYIGYTGIVYALSRDNVDNLTAELVRGGISTMPYHAGLSASKRSEAL